MRISVRLDSTAPRRWHVRLMERLAARADCVVAADVAPAAGGLPANADLLFRLETMIHRLPRPGLATPVPASALMAFADGGGEKPDLVLDLRGGAACDGIPVWTLDFDGVLGDAALLASLLDRRSPIANVRAAGRPIATARLGTEYGGIALASFEDCLARTITLILAALDGAASAALPDRAAETASVGAEGALSLKTIAKSSAKALARTIVRRLYYLCYHAPHWRTGWRRVAGPDVLDMKGHPDSGWHTLPDDGQRFYADPFPIEHDGKVILFVEDFEHRRQKGIISAVAFGPDGPVGRPVPVLDLPYHLSYPFVFEEGGVFWMIPESGAAKTIDLYRAHNFPGGWERVATLVDGVVASDATLLRHDGKWWMFATVRDEGGAFSDALHLWSALDFRGPWTAHRRNPVLIDIASARPAGRIVKRDGVLMRPVQDCRRGYGAALGLARIQKLDDEGFEQSIDATLTSGPAWPGRRLHSLNRAGDFEFIDGSGHARKRMF